MKRKFRYSCAEVPKEHKEGVAAMSTATHKQCLPVVNCSACALIAALLIFPSTARARIGETLEQSIERYGVPLAGDTPNGKNWEQRGRRPWQKAEPGWLPDKGWRSDSGHQKRRLRSKPSGTGRPNHLAENQTVLSVVEQITTFWDESGELVPPAPAHHWLEFEAKGSTHIKAVFAKESDDGPYVCKAIEYTAIPDSKKAIDVLLASNSPPAVIGDAEWQRDQAAAGRAGAPTAARVGYWQGYPIPDSGVSWRCRDVFRFGSDRVAEVFHWEKGTVILTICEVATENIRRQADEQAVEKQKQDFEQAAAEL